MNDFTTNVEVNLSGDLEEGARSSERALDRMSKSGAKNLARLRRASAGLSNGIDRLGNRYSALAGAIGVTAAARGVVTFSKRLKDIKVQAGLTEGAIANLRKTLYDAAQASDVRIDPDELLSAVDAVIEKTGDIKLATDNIRNMGVAIRATGATGPAIGAVVAGLKKLGITAPTDVAEALEILTEQGKAGAFTMQNMAREAGPLLASMAAMGQKGMSAVRVLGALAQTTQMATDSAAETSTSIQALIREIAVKGKSLEANGVKVFDKKALAEGKEQFLELDTIVKSIIERTQGKMSVLGSAFGEEAQKALKVLAADFGNNNGNLPTLDKFLNVSGDTGQLTKDAADKADEADAAMTALLAAGKRVANNNLAGPIRELADALNDIEPERLNELFDIAGKGAAAAAGIWAVNKGLRAVAGGYRAMQALRGATGGKAAGVLNKATAQPVIVTNWPAGLGGDAGAIGADSKSRRKTRGTGKAGRLSRLAGGAGKLGRIGPLAAILGALSFGTAAANGDGQGMVASGGTVAGALAGGKLGALLGTVLGPLGTAAGGLLGSGLGAYGGEELVKKLYASFSGNTAPQTAPAGGVSENAMAAHTRALEANTAALSSNSRGGRTGHAEFGGRLLNG